jgi:4-carboxymuconolactone decarboxylase
MPAPRIAPLAEPLPPEVAQRLARLLPPGTAAPQLFLTVARNAGSFVQMVDSGFLGPTCLWDRRVLPKALREAVILRTCVACRNHYEFNLHVQTISERMGLAPAQIDDIRRAAPDAALWSEAERAVFALVDALVARLEVTDAQFADASRHFDDATLIEITQLVGFYTGVAMLVGLAKPAFDRYRDGPPVRAR